MGSTDSLLGDSEASREEAHFLSEEPLLLGVGDEAGRQPTLRLTQLPVSADRRGPLPGHPHHSVLEVGRQGWAGLQFLGICPFPSTSARVLLSWNTMEMIEMIVCSHLGPAWGAELTLQLLASSVSI